MKTPSPQRIEQAIPEVGIAGIVSQARKKRGLTQEELAELTHLTVRTIQRIENGKTTPRPYTLRTISTVLNIPFEDLNEPHNAQAPDPITGDTDATKSIHDLRLLCLSCFSYLVLPFIHFLLPLFLLRKMKDLPPTALAFGRRVLRTQIYWLLVLHLLLLLTVAYNFSVAPRLPAGYVLHYLVPVFFMYFANALWIGRALIQCKKLIHSL
nr:helix-turn-helix transcriptional regulator [uncultured Dyadobacter sp.]